MNISRSLHNETIVKYKFHEIVWKKYFTVYPRLNDKHLIFHELLNKNFSVSIHTQNLQFLVTEMYKLAHDISPTIMQEIFKFRNSSKYLI